ncbi:hypothetical protein CEUSTIGMA_g775.t1 [Chlamydomonas eustigma]|uniref:UBC core domain-containing protein n=1 Tax=Chlamydomonas eustigma TaxID=1157962 RepID=A0A250WR99_9CHLO|nr:hypothetical protein CEUSTIGMA_g775.t1 [Chlamydomonas eustigma]|eukprot:GAX73321.1 hypothetical protein CEUSTIGMA_g775.t1 [Chlamydomonas eustigma]
MGTSLTPIAARRIQSELKDWTNNPPEGFLLESCEPMTTWVIMMKGPETPPGAERLYDGKVFRLQVKFPDRYPMESPEVIFLSVAPIHPHIYSNGHICLDILYDNNDGGWSPALTVNKVCLSVRSMLASNTENSKPQGDAEYVARVGSKSPKATRWVFHDDRV